jgi:DNA (cytosine-5)-methyltransferase 1
MIIGSICSGIGGIDLAFQNLGCDIAWSIDMNKSACTIFDANFSHKSICAKVEDIQSSTLDTVNILVAGFPCQAFSVAGHRQGFNDDRGLVFYHILDKIKRLQPRCLFLENVKGLVNHDNGNTFKTILALLQEQGYYCKSKVMNTCDYSDIPQNRERIYIVCFKDIDKFNSFQFPDKFVGDKKTIQDILEHNVDDKYYWYNSKHYQLLTQLVTNPNTLYQWRRNYVRENRSNMCPTLTANIGSGGGNVPLLLDNGGIRQLTERECLRFQGFPDSFILPQSICRTTQYSCIGNSVTVPVIQSIAKNIIEVL